MNSGKARRYLGDGIWVVDRKSMSFTALSVGSAANVYGISGGKLYSFVSHSVQQVDPSQSVVSVSVSPSDGTLWGLDFQQNAHFFDGKNWTDPPAGAPQMGQLCVVDKANVIGTKSAGALLQRWDGLSWTEMSLSSPLAGSGCKTYFACAVKGHRNSVHLFTIDEWKDKSTAVVSRAMFWRVLNADTWVEQSRTQLPGMMMKMSVAFDLSAVIDDSGRNITLWGWNDDPTCNGVYAYDFIAGTWNVVGNYHFPAAVPGGGFVIDGYGSGVESVLRSEIMSRWSSIPMPFRSTVSVVSARNESEFYAASSEGECYHWVGLGWFPVTQPVTQPAGISLVSVSVAEDGSLWVVDSAGVVWERINNTWTSHGGTFSVVSASSGGHAYAWQNNGNKLYRLSAESANWTQLTLPNSSLDSYGASSDGSCTIADDEENLYVYSPGTGAWTLSKNTGVRFWNMSVQDEYHILASSSAGYWVDSEAPPTEVAQQEWGGTDFSGDEWAGWFGVP
jgi:hypothetical protein